MSAKCELKACMIEVAACLTRKENHTCIIIIIAARVSCNVSDPQGQWKGVRLKSGSIGDSAGSGRKKWNRTGGAMYLKCNVLVDDVSKSLGKQSWERLFKMQL